jgi:hypothetical protein
METLKALGKLLIIFCVLGFVVVSVEEVGKSRRTAAAAAAPDPRDQHIKELADKVAELEQKPKDEHHYEFRDRETRTWRFDPATGESCIQLTTNPDWKKKETMRQSCAYTDFMSKNQKDQHVHLEAECYVADNKKACDLLKSFDLP